MKIKIISNYLNAWYKDYIGETFTLYYHPHSTEQPEILYRVVNHHKNEIDYILIEDAILITREEKLKRILNKK